MDLVAERHPLPRLLVFPLGFFALAGMSLAHFYPDLLHRLATCPFRDITTVPCPTCGSTAAATHLAAGHLMKAVAANPLVMALSVLFSLWAVYAVLATAIPAWRRTLVLGPKEKKAARILAAILIGVNWIYLAVR